VATLRVAELHSMKPTRDALEQARKRDPQWEDPVAQLERQTGLKPEQVDRLHVVAIDQETRLGWMVVRTREPLDREAVLAKLTERSEKRQAGRRYYLGKTSDGQEGSVLFGGPNVLVVSTQGGMQRALMQAAQPVSNGPLKPTIALVETSRSQVIVGLNGHAGGLDTFKNTLKQNPLLFADPVNHVQLIRLTLDADEKEAVLTATAEMDDAKRVIPFLGVIGRLQLAGRVWILSLRQKDEEAEMADVLTKVLDSIKADGKGKEARVTARSDPETMATALFYLAQQVMK
jgi:hypothetical protein